MTLAAMVAEDEEALLCDLAETYGIFDLEELPAEKLAAFSCGLGENSRIKRKISGVPVSTEELLLAQILDGINTIAWMLSEDARRGSNRPPSIAERMMGKEEEAAGFDTAEELEEKFRELRG